MQHQGFSLIEILISLFLITGVMLVLLNREIKLTNTYRDIKLKNIALLHLDNASENILAGFNYKIENDSFILESKKSDELIVTHSSFEKIKLSRAAYQFR